VSQEKLQLNKKAAGFVALAVMCSRVLGLVREVLFAGLFGAGRNMDAFFVAFKAPNLLRDLFAEGALSTAFVTVFSQKMQKEGDGAAWALASKMAALTLVFMSGITIGGILLADWIIAILAPGFDAEKAALTVVLTRVMYPFILLVSLAALVMGMLNSKNVFTVPALASSFFNIGSIAGGIGFGYWLDPTFGPKALVGLAIGTLLGGVLQLAVQLPSLHRVGFRWRLDFRWRDSGVRRVLGLMVPSVIAGSAVQVNVMVNSIFASYLEDGAVSWLQYAFRLMQLPLGVFGVAIATVTLPVVARIAAEADWAHFRSTLAGAIRLALFLTIPSALGLAVLAEPIIGLIYERGRFTDAETLRTAQALQFYALGLLGYASIKVLAPAFYAADRRWIPMLASFGAIGLNVILNYVLIFQVGMGHRGLALSTALSATANFLVLFFVMRRQLGGFEGGLFVRTLLSCGVAGAALAGVAWAGAEWMETWWAGAKVVGKAGGVGGVIAVSGLTYLALCWVLRVPEIRSAWALVGRKLGRFGRSRKGG
jgi:putative peptidoglycan lipid II flippase